VVVLAARGVGLVGDSRWRTLRFYVADYNGPFATYETEWWKRIFSGFEVTCSRSPEVQAGDQL